MSWRCMSTRRLRQWELAPPAELQAVSASAAVPTQRTDARLRYTGPSFSACVTTMGSDLPAGRPGKPRLLVLAPHRYGLCRGRSC